MRQEEKRVADMLRDPDAIATPLLVILLDRFGTELFDWEPDTLRMEIRAAWGAEPPQENMDKIWALINIVTTNLFQVSLEFFIHACNALSGNGADFASYDPATVREMCWALSEQHLIDPLGEDEDFSSEILAYMKTSLKEEGFTQVPQILAPHVGTELQDASSVEEGLAVDAIEVNAYWDMQTRKRMEIDEYLLTRMRRLISDLASLPLKNADEERVQKLKSRADTALAARQQEKAQAAETVAPVPFS